MSSTRKLDATVKIYGDLALELWELEHEEISQENVEIIAAKTYDEAVWVEGPDRG